MPTAASLSIEERIVTSLRHLPPERQAEVLDFVEFLNQRRRTPLEPRPYGLCAGEFVAPQDFDAPLPEETLRLFES